MAPITRVFVFMSVSNPIQRDQAARLPAIGSGEISLKFFSNRPVCVKVCREPLR
jgi:hypothetical protein